MKICTVVFDLGSLCYNINMKKANTHPLFDEIYSAAIRGDEAALIRIYQHNGTLDVWANGLHTPISLLIVENNLPAAKLLRKFSSNINHIAYGLALSGKFAKALQCVNKQGAQIKWVIRGLAQAGYVKQALECVTKYGESLACGEGFAIAGDVKNLFKCVDEDQAWSTHIILICLAQGGHVEQAIQIIHRSVLNAKRDHPKTNIDLGMSSVAHGLALMGKIDEAETMTDEHSSYVSELCAGLAEGGYLDEALKHTNKAGFYIDNIVEGLAASGYVKLALECVKKRGGSMDALVTGLGIGGYLELAFEYLAKYKVDSIHLYRGLYAAGYLRDEESIHFVLKFCHNNTDRIKLINSLARDDKRAQKFNLSKKMDVLINERGLNERQAYEWLTNAELRKVMLNFKSTDPSFKHPDSFYMFCQKLCSDRLTLPEIRSLYNNTKLNIHYKQALKSRADNYIGTGILSLFSGFNKKYQDDVMRLYLACSKAHNKDEIISLLTDQKNKFDLQGSKLDKNEGYYKFLEESLKHFEIGVDPSDTNQNLRSKS